MKEESRVTPAMALSCGHFATHKNKLIVRLQPLKLKFSLNFINKTFKNYLEKCAYNRSDSYGNKNVHVCHQFSTMQNATY